MKKILLLLMMVMVGFASCQNSEKKDGENGTCDKASQKECDSTALAVNDSTATQNQKKTIICRAKVKKGQEAAFKKVAEPLIAGTRQEPGNVSYNLYQSPDDPTMFIFYEEYTDQAAFDAHANSDHFKKFADAIPTMLEGDLAIEQI